MRADCEYRISCWPIVLSCFPSCRIEKFIWPKVKTGLAVWICQTWQVRRFLLFAIPAVNVHFYQMTFIITAIQSVFFSRIPAIWLCLCFRLCAPSRLSIWRKQLVPSQIRRECYRHNVPCDPWFGTSFATCQAHCNLLTPMCITESTYRS